MMNTTNTISRRWRKNGTAHYLLLLIPALYTPVIMAATDTSFGCGISDPTHGGSVNFSLPTPVVFQQGSLPPVGQVLYSHHFPTQSYICHARGTNPLGFQASLAATISGDYFNQLQTILARAGLALRFRIYSAGTGDGVWIPDNRTNQFYPVSRVYGKTTSDLSTGNQSFDMTAELYVKERITRPLKINLPASPAGAIRLVWKKGGDDERYPNIKFNSSAADLWYLPTCIGKVTIPQQVRFNRIYTGADKYAGTLPQGKTFVIKAQYNTACGYPDMSTGYDDLNLNLAIKFTPESPGRVDNKYIYLKNDDGEENGLRLRIRNINSSTDAVFNTYSNLIPLRSTSGVSSNMFSAELEKNPSAGTIKTGSFTQRVKVNIDYY
ncbi:fimbrial protein [Salmonella enterica]|nr:fimbrial protein [Salmonella enterica]EEG5324293.1 fimbrial protein [Salmonella enterica]EGG5310760.1 fimbrial protein [Salmonella enterica]